MDRPHSGFAIAKVVIVVVVLAVAAGAILYLTSDVFSTRMEARFEQFAHWTPENIAKDPENYLNFCEKQANKALQDLKANEISIAQSRAKLETMQADAGKKVTVGEKALTELKDMYQKADGDGAWPINWQSQSMDKERAKRQIVALHREMTGQKNLLNKVEGGIKKLDAQVGRVQDARSKAQEQLAEIKTSREMLKVQKLTDDLTNRLVSMKGVLQATISSASETTGIVSLDQLATEAGTVVDDKEFEKIMSGTPTAQPK